MTHTMDCTIKTSSDMTMDISDTSLNITWVNCATTSSPMASTEIVSA